MIDELPARLGICATPACETAANGPIELYDGPGRYCPACGEPLRLYTKRLRLGPPPAAPAPAQPARSRWAVLLGIFALTAGIATGVAITHDGGGAALDVGSVPAVRPTARTSLGTRAPASSPSRPQSHQRRHAGSPRPNRTR